MSVEPSAFLLKEQELMKLNEEINIKTKSILNRVAKPPPPKLSRPVVKDVKPPQNRPPPVVAKPSTTADSSKFTLDEEPVRDDGAKPSDDPSTTSPSAATKLKSFSQKSPKATPTQQPPPAVPKNLERRNLSSEGLIKFLKSKVTILQDEIDLHQKENLKRTEELQQLQQKSAKWEQQRDQLNAKNNSLQGELAKAEEKIIELELRIKERDNDTVRLGREGENTRRDMKTMQATVAALEKRLSSAHNEIESLKVSLAGAYDRERESREQARSDKSCLEKQLRQLRKQRVTLITAYKQQLLLLDNLRRQNLCLEESKMLEFSEKEFTKILNWEK